MKSKNVTLKVASKNVALFNVLRDLGKLQVEDVPPSFMEKFVEASKGKFSNEEAVLAAVTLSSVADCCTFSEFEQVLAGKWPKKLKEIKRTQGGLKFDDYSSTMLRVIEGSELQAVERTGLAMLQYNWG